MSVGSLGARPAVPSALTGHFSVWIFFLDLAPFIAREKEIWSLDHLVWHAVCPRLLPVWNGPVPQFPHLQNGSIHHPSAVIAHLLTCEKPWERSPSARACLDGVEPLLFIAALAAGPKRQV